MTEIENSDPSATSIHASNHVAGHAPYTAPYTVPDLAPGGGVLPPLTKASLNTLCDSGVISTVAWQRAVEFCGFRPDGKAWLAYWRQMFLLGGALFFLAGMICFIAWNWGAMTPFARMALTGALVAGSGLGAVLLGPDTRLGQVLLLACGIAMGPMLAVFGQTYQTGAELWELFRVWTALLVLLALAGRQAGLWFAAWISANIFAALWLGRSLSSPLDALGQFFMVPEWLVAIACAIACWEWMARRAATRLQQNLDDGPDNAPGQSKGQNESQSKNKAHAQAWLCSRWMPRLLFFDMVSRTTFFLIATIFDLYFRDGQMLWLSPNFVVGFALVTAGFSWWWYRIRQPDLFMLATLLAAGAAVLLSALAEAELFFSAGSMATFLLWGLLVTGVTAGLAKILLHLQRSMITAPRQEAETVAFFPSILARATAGNNWQTLWAHLQAGDFVPLNQSLSDALGRLGAQPSPWYVRGMLAFGGWVAAVFFIAFFGFLLFESLGISSNEELTVFAASVPVLLMGRVLLARPQLFARHFGFALVIAGTVGLAIALCASIRPEGLACFALAGVLLALGILMGNAGYAMLAAVVIGNCVALGIAFSYGYARNGFAASEAGGAVELLSLWWALVCAGLACYCLREHRWRGTARGNVTEGWFYGFYASVLILEVFTLAPAYSLASYMGLPGLTSGYLGIAPALAVAALAYWLGKGAGKPARLLTMAGMPLVFALSWYLPGAGLALLGLTLARRMGSVVMQGFVLAYLFAYMVFYYYSLAVPFSQKSIYLMATGLGLLALALILRLWQAKTAAREAAHA
ncbi:DUF2157 domain-containing protein [uncultured Desulfovibrio sp.]|uniref:DUF2157 domain-containing protein n=1 Tax=uncultured Desulfovibrio sp. TaxID=167968 RepID=UPI00262F81D3|nr:DUF2157 domain-containing protein [uncultured Desulfovibrio sp.]